MLWRIVFSGVFVFLGQSDLFGQDTNNPLGNYFRGPVPKVSWLYSASYDIDITTDSFKLWRSQAPSQATSAFGGGNGWKATYQMVGDTVIVDHKGEVIMKWLRMNKGFDSLALVYDINAGEVNPPVKIWRCTYFTSDGRKKLKEKIVHSTLYDEGRIWRYFLYESDESGRILQVTEYRQSDKHGKEKAYNADGTLKHTGKWKQGLKHGTWTYYSEGLRKEKWEKGVLIKK